MQPRYVRVDPVRFPMTYLTRPPEYLPEAESFAVHVKETTKVILLCAGTHFTC